MHTIACGTTLIGAQCINNQWTTSSWDKAGLDVTQNHPLYRMRSICSPNMIHTLASLQQEMFHHVILSIISFRVFFLICKKNFLPLFYFCVMLKTEKIKCVCVCVCVWGGGVVSVGLCILGDHALSKHKCARASHNRNLSLFTSCYHYSWVVNFQSTAAKRVFSQFMVFNKIIQFMITINNHR